jgi:hypothetical protein
MYNERIPGTFLLGPQNFSLWDFRKSFVRNNQHCGSHNSFQILFVEDRTWWSFSLCSFLYLLLTAYIFCPLFSLTPFPRTTSVLLWCGRQSSKDAQNKIGKGQTIVRKCILSIISCETAFLLRRALYKKENAHFCQNVSSQTYYFLVSYSVRRNSLELQATLLSLQRQRNAMANSTVRFRTWPRGC